MLFAENKTLRILETLGVFAENICFQNDKGLKMFSVLKMGDTSYDE